MMQSNTIIKLSVCLLTLLLVFGFAPTQNALAISESSISVDVAPSNPVPYENTTITLSSFAANLDSVTISWFVNGKADLSGIGKKSFSVSVGAAGVKTIVAAKIFLPDGEIDKTITLIPSVMVLLWQANDSYVPPFYKGKAMPVAQSEIKVVAMPEIKTASEMVNPKNMTYSWEKDYNNLPADSGYGKSFFTYINDYLDGSNNVSVTASTVDQQYSSGGSINVGTISPEISFYKKDSNLGIIWEQALGDNHQITGEEIVVAVPYFISPKEIQRPELVFNWSIDDKSVTLNSRKYLMPLKVQPGASGTSKLHLDIENTDKIFQTVSKEINIKF